jgi:hypothetical protein
MSEVDALLDRLAREREEGERRPDDTSPPPGGGRGDTPSD